MKLYIDSSNNLETLIKIDDQEFRKSYVSPRDQDVLGAISEAMKAVGKNREDISEIEVNPGPGSFTGIRVGISIAQALSFALDIPVNKQPASTPIEPNYGKPASITLSEKNGM